MHRLRLLLVAVIFGTSGFCPWLGGGIVPSHAAADPAPPTDAAQALLLETDSGRVLFERNVDARMVPSSLTKLMTAYLVFEALESGVINGNTRFPVSIKAWKKGGSRMFLEPNSRVRVADLLRGLLVQSGNDAAIVLAEGLAGTETAFADRMNAAAQRLGLERTHFANATGWPAADHFATARDIAGLAARLIADFPQHYALFAERSFTWNGITQANRNPILGRVAGADGLKTGHTEAGGYGVAASARRGRHRLILVINGLDSARARRSESIALLNWGFDRLTERRPDHPIRRKPTRIAALYGAAPPAGDGIAVRPQRKPANAR